MGGASGHKQRKDLPTRMIIGHFQHFVGRHLPTLLTMTISIESLGAGLKILRLHVEKETKK
jgi:hypothetical protein